MFLQNFSYKKELMLNAASAMSVRIKRLTKLPTRIIEGGEPLQVSRNYNLHHKALQLLSNLAVYLSLLNILKSIIGLLQHLVDDIAVI